MVLAGENLNNHANLFENVPFVRKKRRLANAWMKNVTIAHIIVLRCNL